MVTMKEIPTELIYKILSYMNAKEAFKFTSTTKYFKHIRNFLLSNHLSSIIRSTNTVDIWKNMSSFIHSIALYKVRGGMELNDLCDYLIDSFDDIYQVKELKLCSRTVDCSFIAQFIGLKNLSFKPMPIKDISCLSPLTELESLIIKHTRLQNIQVLQNFKNLFHADLSYTYIRNIDDLYGLPLRRLSLRGNNLAYISSLSSLIHLEELDLGNNHISSIHALANLHNLQVLLLDVNQLRSVDYLSQLLELRSLDVSENRIIDLNPLSKLHNLKILNFKSNWVESLEGIFRLSNLIELNGEQNRISKLNTDDIINHSKLTFFNVKNNKILCRGLNTTQKPIPKLASPLTELYIDCQVRQIWSDNRSFWIQADPHSSMDLLTDVSFLYQLNALKRLEIKASHIKEIESLSHLIHLVHLDLSSNEISNISPLSELAYLKSLNLKQNRVVDLQPLGKLNDLKLNKFKSTTIPHLEYLNVTLNPIADTSCLMFCFYYSEFCFPKNL